MVWPKTVYAAAVAILLWLSVAQADDAPSEAPPSRYRFHLHAGWPEGITYEMGTNTPELHGVGPLTYFEEVYLEGRIDNRTF